MINIEAFNKTYPLGTKMFVVQDDDTVQCWTLEKPAALMGNHTPVAWFKEKSGCYNLERVIIGYTLMWSLIDAPPNTDAVFADIISKAVKVGVSLETIAAEFKVSAPSIKRWARGRNFPISAVRWQVTSRIAKLVDSRAEQCQC